MGKKSKKHMGNQNEKNTIDHHCSCHDDVIGRMFGNERQK